MKVKMFAKHILHKLPKSFIKTFYKVYNFLVYPNMREDEMKYGNLNTDKIFYIIRPRTDCVEGLMSLLLNVCRNLHYAERHGYIPVVDFENYETQYRDLGCKEKNSWKFYFEQTSKYDLHEVYQSANVRLSGLKAIDECSEEIDQKFDFSTMYLCRCIMKKYINFSKPVIDMLEKESKLIDLENSLALYLRGTDYIKLKPAGHPIQPSVEQAIEVADIIMKKYNLQSVFLVTEDYEIYEKIKTHYGKSLKIVSYDSFIEGYKGTEFLSKDSSSITQLAESPYKRGLNYLCKLIILSKCRCFVGGNTCGSWAACSFSEGYDEQYIFDLGQY